MLEKPYLDDVCRIGQGAACCRYLVGTPDKGIQCGKLTSLRRTIDQRVRQDAMTAKGNNCEGLPED